MGMNSMLQSMFQGLAESDWNKNRLKKQRFDELNQEYYLFSSDYLNSIMDDCKTKKDYEAVLDHMYTFDACEVESYKEIEDKIIKKYW